MQKILITGVSGSGKSTVCKELKKLGYEAYGIEDIPGMFDMYHKGTKRVFENYSNKNPEHIKNAEWLCDVDKLKQLLDSQKSKFSFYCGIASNMDDILPLFDKVFVLQPDSEILNERLKNREGSDNIGNTQDGRDVVLGWKDWWENKMMDKGAIFINANGTPKEVTKKILSRLKISNS